MSAPQIGGGQLWVMCMHHWRRWLTLSKSETPYVVSYFFSGLFEVARSYRELLLISNHAPDYSQPLSTLAFFQR